MTRRSLRVVFALFLASGATVGAYFAWALADWIRPEGEGAFGLLFVGAFSFLPVVLAWVVGGIHLFMGSRDRDVRLGVALTTAHLIWWVLVIAMAVWRIGPSGGWAARLLTTVEPGLYAAGITLLAARWFWWRRGDGSGQARA